MRTFLIDDGRKVLSLNNGDDVAVLAGTLVSTAQSLLSKQRGEFFPLAASIDASGKTAMVGADLGVEQPKSTEVIEFLRNALRAQAEQKAIRACGICLNVAARLPGYADKVDAICCQIERADSQPVQLFVPFRKGFLGRYFFDKPVMLPGQASIFPASARE